MSGTLIRPLGKSIDGCAVTFITHLDPGGSVPSFLVNHYSTVQPVEKITALKNILTKEQGQVSLSV